MLDIEGEALFRAVGPDKMGGLTLYPGIIVAGEIAAITAFNLDNPGAEFRQLPGTQRRGDSMFQRQNGDAGKWWRVVHGCLFSAEYCRCFHAQRIMVILNPESGSVILIRINTTDLEGLEIEYRS